MTEKKSSDVAQWPDRSILETLQPDTLLTRRELAKALTASGFKISEASLATRVSRGGSPPYRLWGNRPLYRWADALDWARGRLSKPVTSTSELEVA